MIVEFSPVGSASWRGMRGWMVVTRSHVPGRREAIALRCPCFAQALGGCTWPPVERMHSTPGKPRSSRATSPVLHAPSRDIEIPQWWSRRTRGVIGTEAYVQSSVARRRRADALSRLQYSVLGAEALQGGASCASKIDTSNSTAFEVSSKRRKGFPSETHVKRGDRVVGGHKELLEKPGRNDPCPCGSGRRFQTLLHVER